MQQIDSARLGLWEIGLIVLVFWVGATIVRGVQRKKAREAQEREMQRHQSAQAPRKPTDRGGDYVDYEEVQ